MKLAECFNGTKSSDKPKDQGKFDFTWNDYLKKITILIFTGFLLNKQSPA